VKRRALLLGALLMPTAARAKTTKQASKPAARKVAAPPPPPTGPQPLKEAKSQLVAFNASPFPYRGNIPSTNKPFLDAKDGKRRGHTTSKGDVCWEDAAYSDRRSLLFLPAGYNPQLPSLIVLYLHGQGATLERDVQARQGVPRQISESGQNVALVAPQLAFDAADSSAGNFWKPGHFATYIDEAAERLMRLYGDRRVGAHFNAAPVVIVSYSGGYLSTAYALERGGAAHRIKGVILLDSLYGDEDKFAGWASSRRRLAFLLSAYTELPERSSYKLVMTVKPLIGPQTELFSIGQYRETLSPYLQRTLTLVEFEGELAFGISQEPGRALSGAAFLARWNASANAVVFIPPAIFETWRGRGLQGRVIGGDNQTLVVSRL